PVRCGGSPRCSTWRGENHLWVRYRKGSNLSGLVEPRIPVALAQGVSTRAIAFYSNFQLKMMPLLGSIT
ncbi:hypothetical protein ACE1AT_29435, partial [Pelatocladus sp. BLCC-F211]